MTYSDWDKAERIAEWIKDRHPDPITQTQVMQRFRIRKRYIYDIEKILMDHRAVVIDPYPNTNGRPGSHIHYSLGDGYMLRSVPEVERVEDEDDADAEESEIIDADSVPSVYFALAPSINRMKVGWTAAEPSYRVFKINQSSPVEVVLIGFVKGKGVKLEKTLHRMFREHHLKGEWFTASEIIHRVILLDGFTTAPIDPAKILRAVSKESDTPWTPESWTMSEHENG